ncbi:hypothetical protein [Thiomicrorhabdus sp.]|uniref:hypothetical protein n=1 Tax=Thiomicrorhabdus sp. TaxID=2039724 RepID=UPI0029C7EA0C|nr:hypothetical protein [Thiomicrorhabdus sp.]
MHEVIQKSFGGLTTKFYIQHFIWGLLFGVLFILSTSKGELIPILLGVLNTLLYPYSRFGLESGLNKLFGGDGDGALMDVKFIFLEKFVAILVSWFFALIIAPFSLAYIYHLNNKS